MDAREKILAMTKKGGSLQTGEVAKALKVSRQYAQRMLKMLVEEGLLLKSGSTRNASYALPGTVAWRYDKRFRNVKLAEHSVLEDVERRPQFRESLSDNVKSIFDYAFSEMLNNAIEHSGSKNIRVNVEKRGKTLHFSVNDAGVGVFRNIMRKRKLRSELEAIQDLLKGKTTTQPKAHSGEGIFFTSKAADIFILESFGKRLTIDNRIEDIFIEDVAPAKKGTSVSFQVSMDSEKHLNEVFSAYQTEPDEYGFDKTEIHVRLFTLGTVHVSRSQARRILSGLEKFQSVILDFKNVPSIGQAFADEIFRVFRSKHPRIRITAVNMNENVRFWVERVGK